MISQNIENLTYGGFFLIAGFAGWFLLPFAVPRADKSKIPLGLLKFAFRFIGILVTIAALCSFRVQWGERLGFFICGLGIFVFANFLIKMVFFPSRNQFVYSGRAITVLIIAGGFFLILAAIFPSRMPQIHHVNNSLSDTD